MGGVGPSTTADAVQVEEMGLRRIEQEGRSNHGTSMRALHRANEENRLLTRHGKSCIIKAVMTARALSFQKDFFAKLI